MKIHQLHIDQNQRAVFRGRSLSDIAITYYGQESSGGWNDRRKDTAHSWIERCIEWLFTWLWNRFAKNGARAWYKEIVFDRSARVFETVPGGVLMEHLKLSEYQLKQIWREEAEILVIGSREYFNLTREVADSWNYGSFSYNQPFEVVLRGILKRTQLKIFVVPCLEGWALLPKM